MWWKVGIEMAMVRTNRSATADVTHTDLLQRFLTFFAFLALVALLAKVTCLENPKVVAMKERITIMTGGWAPNLCTSFTLTRAKKSMRRTCHTLTLQAAHLRADLALPKQS